MDLTPTRTTESYERDKPWLKSQHGHDTVQTITLDIAGGSFDDLIVDGVIPSGVPLKLGGDGLYDRAAAQATVADGHLWEPVITKGGDTAGGSLFWHGVVVLAEVPVNADDSAFVIAQAAKHVKYV